MAIGYGQPFPHPDQWCKNGNCQGRIFVRARWSNDNWGGLDTPMGDEKWCENNCPPHLSGAYDAA